MTTRPTFGQWIKQSWVDIVTMLVTGVVGQVVSPNSHASNPSAFHQMGPVKLTMHP
jgi:hypothetical protein